MATSITRMVANECPGSVATFLDGLAAQDFPAVRAALASDVHLRALLPDGLREWTGSDTVAARFERWFGNTERFAAVERGAGEVGDRFHLRWRFRLQAERLGSGWFVVEQVAYCDIGEQGIIQLDLLCTGYLSEPVDG